MRLCLLTVPYHHLSLEEALTRVRGLGINAVELGTGNFPGAAHCDPEVLLADADARSQLKKTLAEHDMTLSALSQHGNPLHPDPERGAASHEVWRRTLQLAEALEVGVVNAFSGCPGDSEAARHPNWITCAWPPEFREVLDWQWTERVLPYWTREAEQARRHGVQIGIEMHPGMSVYNPDTLLRLREACGDTVAANFDPSHLFWQGIDPVEAVAELGGAGAIVHVHAKDVWINPAITRRNGVLDTHPYDRPHERAWIFRTVGYGHPEPVWRDLVTALRLQGYDGVLSIEHEDELLSVDEGIEKTVTALRAVMPVGPIP